MQHFMAVLQTQASNEAAKAKEAFYQKALQDLTLFKSKTNAALLQVQVQVQALPVQSTLRQLIADKLRLTLWVSQP